MTSIHKDMHFTEFESVRNAYQNDSNILVRDSKRYSCNHTLVFLSSNGLYYPNEEHIARRALEDNRYEWAKTAPWGFRQYIFVRDPLKQWYWDGCCAKHSSLELLAKQIQSLHESREISFIGMSSGGYASIVLASFFPGSSIIAFMPQLTLKPYFSAAEIQDNPILARHRDSDSATYQRYTEISSLISSTVERGSRYIHIYPGESSIDIDQLRHLTTDNSKRFVIAPLPGKAHQINILPPYFPTILRLLVLKRDLSDEIKDILKKTTMSKIDIKLILYLLSWVHFKDIQYVVAYLAKKFICHFKTIQ